MSDAAADMRAWLAANRPDITIGRRGTLPAEAIDAWRQAHPEPAGDEHQDDDDATPGEVAPEVPATRARQRRRLLGERAPQAARAARRGRASIENIASGLWAGLGTVMATREQLSPVARVMELQAPAAGVVLNEVVRGTVVDTVLQPFARVSARGETVWGLVGPPLLVAAALARPQLQRTIRPMLRSALESWVVTAGPAMRRAEAKRARLRKELGGGDDADQQIDKWIDIIFNGLPVTDGDSDAPPF